MHFLYIQRTVHRSCADSYHAAGIRMSGNRRRVHDVLRTVRRQRGGRAHGAGEHHRFFRLTRQLQEISGFLQRVRAMRDDDALDLVIRQKMAHARCQSRPDVKAHVLAVKLTHLLADDGSVSSQRRNGFKQLLNAHLCGGVANVVSGILSFARNGSARSQNDQFLMIHKIWLLFYKSCMKLQWLAIHTVVLNFQTF